MVIYSVFITLDNETESAWVDFMNNKHISDVMKTGCFTGYVFMRENESPEKGKIRFRVDYHLLDSDKMDKYLNEFSNSLRNDVAARFDGKFEAERRIYNVIKSFI